MEKFWQQPEDWKIYLWYGVLALVVVSVFVLLAMVFAYYDNGIWTILRTNGH